MTEPPTEPGPVGHLWRVFAIPKDASLLIGAAGQKWPASVEHAVCLDAGIYHEPKAHVPNEACGCGIYGYYEAIEAVNNSTWTQFRLRGCDDDGWVLARCSYWGRTIVATRGVRTEFMRIEKGYVFGYDEPNKPTMIAHGRLTNAYPDVEWIACNNDDLLTIVGR